MVDIGKLSVLAAVVMKGLVEVDVDVELVAFFIHIKIYTIYCYI